LSHLTKIQGIYSIQTRYSKTFKIEAVKKVLSRTSETSISAIAKSLGVANTTLHGWIKAMENKDLRDTSTCGGEKSPHEWSAIERLQAIIDTGQMTPDAISEYCRKKGIFPHHIEQWKADFVKPKQVKDSEDLKSLKKEINKLTHELNRKEKALAEAAALLVLKKKAQEFWGNNEGD
jgi:transposase-like protein